MTSIFGGGFVLAKDTVPTFKPEVIVATDGQTVFNLSTVSYTPGQHTLRVYVNGAKQLLTTNFTETSTSSFTLTSPAVVGDIVEAEVAGVAELGDISQSVTDAQTAATNAAASASAAAAQATAASASATAAASSASAASTSASGAATSATSAGTSATNAASSATAAAGSATSASTSATNAANSATSASTSAGNAASSATSASNSASTATTQAGNASTSATAAAGSATAAATSATNASNSATAAANSASSAAASVASLSSFYTITDGASVNLDPSNGMIQTWTINASRTPTATGFNDGESMTLHLASAGSAYTVTWPSVTWVDSLSPPVSNAYTCIIALWKVNSIIYGAYIGAV